MPPAVPRGWFLNLQLGSKKAHLSPDADLLSLEQEPVHGLQHPFSIPCSTKAFPDFLMMLTCHLLRSLPPSLNYWLCRALSVSITSMAERVCIYCMRTHSCSSDCKERMLALNLKSAIFFHGTQGQLCNFASSFWKPGGNIIPSSQNCCEG